MSDWRTMSLADVVDIVAGISPRGSDILQHPAKYPFHQGVRDFGRLYPSHRTYCEAPLRLARKGDILISVRAPIGRINVAPCDLAIGRGLMALRGRHQIVNEYLLYFLESLADRWNEFESSGSVFANLGKTGLGNVLIPLPPLSEQRAIAATLGALDDKIESNGRICNLLEQEALSYFELWFPVDFNEQGVAISALVNINPSRALKKGEVAPYVGMSGLPTNSAIVEGWELREFGSGQRFRNGDVLMARITPCLENGKTAVVDMLSNGEVGWGSTEYVVLEPKPPFSTPWVYCLARSEAIRSFAIRSMSGTSGRQRFPSSAFDQYRIIEPSQEQVCKFNSIMVPAFEKMAQLRDENLKLSSLRDALLPELLSGRIRVPEAQEAVQAVV